MNNIFESNISFNSHSICFYTKLNVNSFLMSFSIRIVFKIESYFSVFNYNLLIESLCNQNEKCRGNWKAFPKRFIGKTLSHTNIEPMKAFLYIRVKIIKTLFVFQFLNAFNNKLYSILITLIQSIVYIICANY